MEAVGRKGFGWSAVAIRDWEQGQRIEEFVALRKVERKEHAGGERLILEFGDQSGRIDGVMWDGYHDVVDLIEAGDVVRVRGIVGSFRDKAQIKVEKIRPVHRDEARPEDFLPRSPIDAGELAKNFDACLESLTNPHLCELMKRLFETDNLREKYLTAAAGKLWHHNTVGGLVEHSLNVVRICESACGMYEGLDRDLLVCGALLHDIGKVEQYEMKASIDFSTEGRLVGHINTGDHRVAHTIAGMDDFPTELGHVLRHLIVSHQGELEKGSPVVPMMPEAFVLNFADELDSKMGALRRIAENTGDADWSEYVNLIGRYLYFGHRKAGESARES